MHSPLTPPVSITTGRALDWRSWGAACAWWSACPDIAPLAGGCSSAAATTGIAMLIQRSATSEGPRIVAASIAINAWAPVTKTVGSSLVPARMSKIRLATQVPIGMVMRIGWNGCPYGPASGVRGRLAA